MIKYTLLLPLLLCGNLHAAGLFDDYQWPKSAFDNDLDWAAYYTPKGNCLDFARSVQDKVSGSTIYAIEYYPIDHAVVCYLDACVDNGTISDGWFDRTDLAHYKILGTVKTEGR